MPLRPPAGFISAFYDPLKNPNAPTIGTATAGEGSASVTFTAPSNVGGSAITLYGAVSTPGGITGTSASSPVSVTGLTNGTAYTFAVWATNSYGPSVYSSASNSVTPVGTYAVWAGGETVSGLSNVMDYVSIGSTGNATDFGDIAGTSLSSCTGGCGSTTRGLFGFCTSSGSNEIKYITYASQGNSTNFGTLNEQRVQGAAVNDATRAVFAGGQGATGYSTKMDYVTIATTGNAANFGSLGTGRRQVPAGVSSPTRGCIAGGELDAETPTSSIQYITIATTGSASSFGNLSRVSTFCGGASNSTRGIFKIGSGSGTNNVLDYITIATTGNAVDFGDYSTAMTGTAGGANTTRAVFGMGENGSGTIVNIIEYVTIATTGNSTDFGDLTVARRYGGCASSANGGTQ